MQQGKTVLTLQNGCNKDEVTDENETDETASNESLTTACKIFKLLALLHQQWRNSNLAKTIYTEKKTTMNTSKSQVTRKSSTHQLKLWRS